MGMFSPIRFLVVNDSLYYSCACIKEADEEIACGNAAFMWLRRACPLYRAFKTLIEVGYNVVLRMALELIKFALPTFVFGLVAGIVITRLQFKLTLQKRDIGMVIDLAFIERNISQLKSLTSNLDKLVEQIGENGVELREQIKLTEDIEFNFGRLKGLKSPLSKINLELKTIDEYD